MPGQLRQAAAHQVVGAELRGEPVQRVLGQLARGVVHQRLTDDHRIHHLDAAAGFEARGEQVGQGLLEVTERLGTVDAERRDRHQHLHRHLLR